MTCRVFVVNCGSSSLKFRLIDADAGSALASGTVERIGETSGPPDHEAALHEVLTGLDMSVIALGAHQGPSVRALAARSAPT